MITVNKINVNYIILLCHTLKLDSTGKKGVNLSVKENAVEHSGGCSEVTQLCVEKAHEEEVFSREDTPTEQHVEAAFLYHAGLS